jgi:hypothetical protein
MFLKIEPRAALQSGTLQGGGLIEHLERAPGYADVGPSEPITIPPVRHRLLDLPARMH